MTETSISTWSVSHGWQWRVFDGPQATSERIVGGYALTEAQANERAHDAAERLL